LIEGFLLSCKVENKSPTTISFYKNILDKFQWFLNKYGIDEINAMTIRRFLGYLKDSPNRWDSKNKRANRPVCAYTVDRYYTGLSALFRWALDDDLSNLWCQSYDLSLLLLKIDGGNCIMQET